jgi:hypothetical protein
MTDATPPAGSPDDALAAHALLFASGLLRGDEADAFESRLGEDQAARDALCQAVQRLRGPAAQGPNPSYRQRVRERLRKRAVRVRPAVWGWLGAAAAVLLVLGLAWPSATDLTEGPGPVAEQVSPAPTKPAAAPEAEEAHADQAKIWAGMPRSDHLRRAHEEEARRKTRSERLSITRPDDRRGRVGEAAPPRR